MVKELPVLELQAKALLVAPVHKHPAPQPVRAAVVAAPAQLVPMAPTVLVALAGPGPHLRLLARL
jgi:hypothetical protein